MLVRISDEDAKSMKTVQEAVDYLRRTSQECVSIVRNAQQSSNGHLWWLGFLDLQINAPKSNNAQLMLAALSC
jgi:hypothetical protein